MNNISNNTAGRISLAKTKGVILASLIVGALALPLTTQAEQQQKKEHPRYQNQRRQGGNLEQGQEQKKEHPQYKLIDFGTFGGPSSGFEDLSKTVNNRGTAIGAADTPVPDPFAPNCFGSSCFVRHAFQWRHGVLTDLGALAEGVSSFAYYINEHGDIVGVSQNGLVDPLTSTPETYAVLWKNGQIINLGALGGNGSIAVALNNRGQAVGGAANTVPDPFSLLGALFGGPFFATQTRAFLWENGVMRDLGTLGGPDSHAWYVNERGQVAGISYTDSTPNDTTGLPTLHPFLWENGRMHDLGSLGGSSANVDGMNNRGAVVGFMTLPGDEFQHPFLWSGGTLRDLGTFGGSNGEATGVNDAGEACGVADLPNGLHNAFLWKNGVMTDLGNFGRTSSAHAINSKGQIVGASRVSSVPSLFSAFLWEKGDPMIDLNTVIPANSSLHLAIADYINDRGEITGIGVPPGVSVDDLETLGHAFVLVPLDEE